MGVGISSVKECHRAISYVNYGRFFTQEDDVTGRVSRLAGHTSRGRETKITNISAGARK